MALAAAASPKSASINDLSVTEQFGRDAFALRGSASYSKSKAKRPRHGEPWDMVGCLQHAGPVSDGGSPLPASLAGGAPTTPTSGYMEGSIAVGIVIVEGPTDDLKFSAAEKTKVVAEVQNGLGWYAAQNPAAGITFTYDIQVVSVDVPADPNAADLEGIWRDPAIGALGYSSNWAGVSAYVEHLRTAFGTKWTYCGFFVKYPLSHFAYASIGGPRIAMEYSNDGWGPDNIDRVFAHETGHVFGCPDEYAGAQCNCGGSWGRFGTPNQNCENCAPGGGAMCLMKGNDFTHCGWTPSHLGWGKGVTSNPALCQSRFGTKGNFELVAPSAYAGIDFMWRNNDAAGTPWSEPTQFGQYLGHVDAVTMIQSNFGAPGNLELVARVGDTLQFFWRDSGPAFRWNGPIQIAAGATGNPVLIQSRLGKRGNFELAYPLASGGIAMMWRDNDAPGRPWSAPATIGAALGQIDAVSLIQSNFGAPGNLELVARKAESLHAMWRDSGPAWRWSEPVKLTTKAAGNPVLIQSRFGGRGNFELAYPHVSGGLGIMWRNNDSAKLPWSSPIQIGQTLGRVEGIAMIQSNFGNPGNLEVIAETNNTLQFLWRDSGPGFRWTGPFRVL